MLVLQHDVAPLILWCYALIFVVYCLNNIAKKPLVWEKYLEMLNGYAANISPSRFVFWQPVKLFDELSLTNSRWLMYRFIIIAWEKGDQFTFKIWSEHGGDWSKVQEYTPNVVRPVHVSKMHNTSEEVPDMYPFKFQNKVNTNKQKYNREKDLN